MICPFLGAECRLGEYVIPENITCRRNTVDKRNKVRAPIVVVGSSVILEGMRKRVGSLEYYIIGHNIVLTAADKYREPAYVVEEIGAAYLTAAAVVGIKARGRGKAVFVIYIPHVIVLIDDILIAPPCDIHSAAVTALATNIMDIVILDIKVARITRYGVMRRIIYLVVRQRKSYAVELARALVYRDDLSEIVNNIILDSRVGRYQNRAYVFRSYR